MDDCGYRRHGFLYAFGHRGDDYRREKAGEGEKMKSLQGRLFTEEEIREAVASAYKASEASARLIMLLADEKPDEQKTKVLLSLVRLMRDEILDRLKIEKEVEK